MRACFCIVCNILLLAIICICQETNFHDSNKKGQKREIATKYMSSLIHEVCLPSECDRLVYRYKNDSHIFIGFDDIHSDTVYLMTWEINKDKLIAKQSDEYQQIPASEIRGHVTIKQMIAATNKEIQVKFRKKIRKCTDSRVITEDCVIKSFAEIAKKMKKVTFDSSCSK